MMKSQEKNEKRLELFEYLIISVLNPNYLIKKIQNDD